MILSNLIYLLYVFLALFIVLIVLLNYIISAFHKITYRRKIEAKLKKFCNNESFKFEKVKDMPYDIKLELKHFIYYIKLIYVSPNYDILIQDEKNWILKNINEKKGILHVENVSSLIEYNSKGTALKPAKKIFMIYPGSGNIIKYINPYESEFVYPNTDVFGCNIFVEKDLYEDNDILV